MQSSIHHGGGGHTAAAFPSGLQARAWVQPEHLTSSSQGCRREMNNLSHPQLPSQRVKHACSTHRKHHWGGDPATFLLWGDRAYCPLCHPHLCCLISYYCSFSCCSFSSLWSHNHTDNNLKQKNKQKKMKTERAQTSAKQLTSMHVGFYTHSIDIYIR